MSALAFTFKNKCALFILVPSIPNQTLIGSCSRREGINSRHESSLVDLSTAGDSPLQYEGMVKVIFALIFLQFPSFVIASECPTTNLMDSSPISKRSDLGQSGMGWCCSYAFTDALSIKAGFNVSPVDIGITQARFTGKTASCYPLEEVLESIQKSNGLCREEDYLSNSSAEILISTSNPFHSSIVKIAIDSDFLTICDKSKKNF